MNIRKACSKKKIKHRKEKQLLSGLSLLLIVCILSNVGIAALYPQLVYASFSGTVAGYILTLFASFNTAITNPNVVSAINNTFGSMALEAADAGVIDQGIAQIAQTTGFDMASIFSNTAAEAAQFAQAAGVEIENVASTAGENLAAGAAACAASAGAVLPAIAGTVLPAAAAVGLGVAGGILIDHVRNAIINYVKNGLSLDTPKNVMNAIPVDSFGFVGFKYGTNSQMYMYSNSPYAAGGYWVSGNNTYISVINKSNSDITVFIRTISSSGSVDETPYNVIPNGKITRYSSGAKSVYGTQYANESDLTSNAIPSINNKSPDIIGDIGFQTGQDTGNGYSLPYIYPVYNYGNTVINYITPSDYDEFVQQDPTTGEDFDDFVDPYINPIDTDQPVDPENPIPQPTIAPVQPVIPPQPTPAPEPTLTPEETEEMPRGMVQPSLKDKFPFCIPFDIGYLLNKMSAEREAPRFAWQLDFGQWGQYTINVDLSPFDSVAAILRTLELILFILGLMLATKSLMSTSDGG